MDLRFRVMSSPRAHCLEELLLWRELSYSNTGLTLTFQLNHNSGDRFIVDNAQDDPSSDEVQVGKVSMRSIELDLNRHN